MKAQKVTFRIETETLSTDCVASLVEEVAKLIRAETYDGELMKEDGDNVKWSMKKKNVEF